MDLKEVVVDLVLLIFLFDWMELNEFVDSYLCVVEVLVKLFYVYWEIMVVMEDFVLCMFGLVVSVGGFGVVLESVCDVLDVW